MMLIMILMYTTHMSGMSVSVAWLITSMILCFTLSIAAPPVAGGGVAVISMILSTQGVPEEWHAIAIVALMLLDYISTSGRVAMITLLSIGEN